MKFSDQKRDYFSRLEIEYLNIQYSIWDDYDEYGYYYDEYFSEPEVYLEGENYFKYTAKEIEYFRKIHFGYAQVNIDSFTSLNKMRENKIKIIFGEDVTGYRPTFSDLININ
jgi:hypothetical protein